MSADTTIQIKMVESHTKPDVEDKTTSKNWADEVDGGDDDETQIGGENAPQVPQTEVKERMPTPPRRERNARGEIVVSTIRLRDLDAVKKEVADDSSASEESEPESPEAEHETQPEVKGKSDSD